jgi:hypothetical protein
MNLITFSATYSHLYTMLLQMQEEHIQAYFSRM